MEKTVLVIVGGVALLAGLAIYYPRMVEHFLGTSQGYQYYVHPWEGLTIGIMGWCVAVIVSSTPAASVRSTWILAVSVVLGWIALLGVTMLSRVICQLILAMLTSRSLYGFLLDTVPKLILFHAELLVIYAVGAFLAVGVVVVVDMLLLRLLTAWRIAY